MCFTGTSLMPNPSLERDLHRHAAWPARRRGPSSASRAKRHPGVGPSAQTLGVRPDMSTNTQRVLLELFERHRAEPGAPYEQSHFVDFLLREPRERRAVHNSFVGLRRYNAFLNEVQLHFGVCFSLEDFEASYSLARFVERIEDLQRSPRASLASLRNQERRGFGWGTVFGANFLAVTLVVLAARASIVLAGCLTLLIVVANGIAVRTFIRWRKYQRRLANRISSGSSNDA